MKNLPLLTPREAKPSCKSLNLMNFIVILSNLKDKLIKNHKDLRVWPFQGQLVGLLELIDGITPFLGSWELGKWSKIGKKLNACR